MFYSSSDFAMRGPPPPPLDLDGPPAAPLAAASAGPVQLTTPRKKSSTDASRSCSSEDELEEPTSTEHETEADADASATGEEDDALRLRGGVVRRRKKSPTKRALDDLAKAWAVNLGDDPLHAKHDRVGRSPTGRGTPEKRPHPDLAEMSSSARAKDGHPSERFDKILYSDLNDESEWVRLGKGSFGCVYKGEYLGIEVAIKEVMHSTEYSVEKYLYREISLMQQARHPNIVTLIGLCLAPPPPQDAITDSGTSMATRILIISEYLPRGNLRQYILDRTLPFPWRLRISFSIDIARALSYLHANPRNCMHRDLKGENLLVTENERLKVCDFGLARVVDEQTASAELQKSRPLTYCGTDGYMSPEILLGEPFTLSTDVFSLGVLFIEIASRTLTSQHHFVRSPPDYGLDIQEVHSSLSPNCPKQFIDLALRCCDTLPDRRPVMKDILSELREIERQVLARQDRGEGDAHSRGRDSTSVKGNVGSISYAGTTKRGSKPGLAGAGGRTRPSAPRLPSFEGKVQLNSSFLAGSRDPSGKQLGHVISREGSESEDDGEALLALAEADVPIDETDDGPDVPYSTDVLKPRSTIISGKRPYGALGSTSGSTLNEGIEDGARAQNERSRSGSLPSLPPSWVAAHSRKGSKTHLSGEEHDEDGGTPTVIARSNPADSPDKKLSYITAQTSTLSIANAVVGYKSETDGDDEEEDEARDVFHSTFQHPPISTGPPPLSEALHRFSLIKPGLQRFLGSFAPYYGDDSAGKCNLCTKRFNVMKAYLACDDCAYACHIKCSDSVAPSCPASAANTPLTSPTFPPKPALAIPSPPHSRTSSKDRTSSKLIKKSKTLSFDGGKVKLA